MNKTLSAKILAVTVMLISHSNSHAENLLQAYQDARENDFQLKAQETGFLATLESKTQALAGKKPQISLSGNAGLNQTLDIDDSDTATSLSANYTLGLTKSLYNRNLNAQIDQVDASILQAKLQLEEQRQALIMRVVQPYFQYLNAVENLRVADTQEKAVKRQLDQVKVYFDVGRSPITDLKEAESRYNLTVAQKVSAQQAVIDAQENLRVVTGKSYPALRGPGNNLRLTPPDPVGIQNWVAIAKQTSKPLQTAKQAIEVARQNIEVQRTTRKPVVNLYARHTGNAAANESPIDPTSLGASVGVEASMSLYQGGAINSRLRQAQHQFRQAQQNYNYQERLIESQVRTAYRNIESSISQVQAQQRALVAAETAAEATKTGFEVGTRTAVDVLTSLSDVFSARRDYANARYNYLLSTLQLRNAAGTLSEDDLRTMSQRFVRTVTAIPGTSGNTPGTNTANGAQSWQARQRQERLRAQRRQQQLREEKLAAQRRQREHEARLRAEKQRQLQARRQRTTQQQQRTGTANAAANPPSAATTPRNEPQAQRVSPDITRLPTNEDFVFIEK